MPTASLTLACDALERHIAGGGFAGGGVVVLKGGDLVLEHYAGNASSSMLASSQVLWPVASISKVYTAAAIMRLVEDGLLTLNTPVHLVLPTFVGGGREEMRVRHLLTHTAGFIYESPQVVARLKAKTPLADLVEEALHSSLLFRPGTQLRYADFNYLVAGHIAEVVTGKPLAELVRTLVLEPAGLSQTFMPPSHRDDARLAHIRGVLAEDTDGAMYNSRYARDLTHPAFGVWATTLDLARFGSMFMPSGPRFLSEAAVRAMTSDQTGCVPGEHPSMKGYAADARIPWAVGFALQTNRVPCLYSDLASFSTFGHGGASGCELICDPAWGLVIAITTNTHLAAGREPWYRRIQSIVNPIFAEFTRHRENVRRPE